MAVRPTLWSAAAWRRFGPCDGSAIFRAAFNQLRSRRPALRPKRRRAGALQRVERQKTPSSECELGGSELLESGFSQQLFDGGWGRIRPSLLVDVFSWPRSASLSSSHQG